MIKQKAAAIFLSLSLVFSAANVCLTVPAVAGGTAINKTASVDAESKSVSGFMLDFERVRGVLVNLFSKYVETLKGTNEANVLRAASRDETWRQWTEPLFSGAPEQQLTAETWRTVELTYESEKEYADPFTDVTLDLLLFGSGRLYTIPGFWDGDGIWRIRFVCPTEGTWQFLTVCSDTDNAMLHGRTGEVSCAAYNGDLAVYRRGFVTTRYGDRYFTYDDGTPFFYLGDTCWCFGTAEPADLMREVCEKRVEQGFTVWQTQPMVNAFDLTDGVTQSDIAGLRDLDEKFGIVADFGLTHANAQFIFPADMQSLIENNGGFSDTLIAGTHDGGKMSMRAVSDEAKHYLERLSRYWVARYSAYPVMWTLGQESDGDFYWGREGDQAHPLWNSINNPYKLVAEYIAEYDPYGHPLTAHQETSKYTVAYGNGSDSNERLHVYNKEARGSAFRDVPAHMFYAAQWAPDRTGRSDFQVERDYWYNGQGKPTVNYEGLYCGFWTKNFGSRLQGWAAFLNGMYGYGWGGHDTWAYLTNYNEDAPTDDGVDIVTAEQKQAATWQDSLEYPSAYQVGYMRGFLEKLDWWDLIPRFDNRAYFVPCRGVYNYYASNPDNTQIVLYLYSFTDESVAERVNTKGNGGVMTGTVGRLEPKAEYAYQWFDPIRGIYSEEKTFIASGTGTWFIGQKPTQTDMVLLIGKK